MRLSVLVPALPTIGSRHGTTVKPLPIPSTRTISSIPNWLKKSRKKFAREPFECWVIKTSFSLFSPSKVKHFELFRPAITFQESVLKRKEWKILAGYKYTHLKIPSNSFDETKIYSFWKIILHWVRSVPAVCTRSKGRDVNGMAAKLVRNFIFCRKTLSAEL